MKRESKTKRIIQHNRAYALMLMLAFWGNVEDIRGGNVDPRPIQSFNYSIPQHSQQGKMVTLSLNKAKVSTFFSEVKRQTGLDFICPADVAKSLPTITVSVRGMAVERALDNVLGKLGCTWSRKGNIITISKRDAMTGRRTLTGTVTDEAGEPLVGVPVRLRGTEVQTITDANGSYSLRIPQKACDVEYRYIGMNTVIKHFKPGSVDTHGDIKMNSDNTLGDVVVTGYQKISRERATGAYSIVNHDELEKRHTTHLADALDGLVAGMQSSSDGRGGKKFTIRGVGTMNANKTPLVVVDGYPIMDNNDVDYKLQDNPNLTALERINPDDVESITLLKDAAAASIWGARSANGVIVITTKKAKEKNAINVEAGTQLSIGQKQDVRHLTNIASARDMVNYQKWVFANDMLTDEHTSVIDNLNNVISPSEFLLYRGYKYGTMSMDEMHKELERLAQLDNTKQIRKYMLQTPVISKTNASISGNLGGWDTRASVQYEHEQGDFIGRHDNTWKIDWQNSYRFNRHISVNAALNIVNSNRHSSQLSYSDLASIAPYEMLLNADGSYSENWNANYSKDVLDLFDWSTFPYHSESYNLLQEARNRTNRTNNTQIRTQLGLELQIIDGLSFNSKFQYETSHYDSRSYSSEESFFVRNNVNYYTPTDGLGNATGTSAVPLGAIIDRGKGKNRSAMFRNDLSLDRVFGGRHTVSAVLGNEISNYYYTSWTLPRLYGVTATSKGTVGAEGQFDTYDGYTSSIDGVPTNGAAHLTDTWNHNRYVSFYGNASYMYDERYGISVSARSDASNMVTSEARYRWSPLWSVGAMWNVNNESWLKNNPTIDRLTLRLTYGKNGNAPTQSSARTTINTQSGVLDNFTGVYPGSISDYGNPTLRWEKTAILNAGIDFALLNNSIYGSVDFYRKHSTDVLGTVNIAGVNGTSYATFNNAAINNTGVEVTLGGKADIGNFSISGTLMWAYNKNKVSKLYVEASDISSFLNTQYVPGYPMNSLFSFQYGGMENGIPTVVDNEGVKYPISDLSIFDMDPKKMLHYNGTTVAPHTTSLNVSISWKDITATAYLNGRFGGKMRMPKFNYSALSAYGSHVNISAQVSDVMDADGNPIANPVNAMPLPTTDSEGNKLTGMDYSYWSFFYNGLNTSVESSDYIYLSEIDLNYALPHSLLNGKWVKDVSLFAKLENVGLLWSANSKHYNPEYMPGSWEPQLTFTLGANIRF